MLSVAKHAKGSARQTGEIDSNDVTTHSKAIELHAYGCKSSCRIISIQQCSNWIEITIAMRVVEIHPLLLSIQYASWPAGVIDQLSLEILYKFEVVLIVCIVLTRAGVSYRLSCGQGHNKVLGNSTKMLKDKITAKSRAL